MGLESVPCNTLSDLQRDRERSFCLRHEKADSALEAGAPVAQGMLLAMPPVRGAENEGLRMLALGTSAAALGGNVRPKRYGRTSTTAEAVACEKGSPRSI
jgi:hypothetical protein